MDERTKKKYHLDMIYDPCLLDGSIFTQSLIILRYFFLYRFFFAQDPSSSGYYQVDPLLQNIFIVHAWFIISLDILVVIKCACIIYVKRFFLQFLVSKYTDQTVWKLLFLVLSSISHFLLQQSYIDKNLFESAHLITCIYHFLLFSFQRKM